MPDSQPADTQPADPAAAAPATPVVPDAPAPAPSRGRRGKGYFLPGFIALIALLIIGLFVGAGDLAHPAPKSLTGTDVAYQISLGVQAQQNSAAPPAVTCPNEPVQQGLHFTCRLQPAGGGPSRPVAVTEVDARGRVSWTLGGP